MLIFLITIPSINAETIDDNILNEDLTNENSDLELNNLDLSNEDLNSITESSSISLNNEYSTMAESSTISSSDSTDKNSNLKGDLDESSQDLINRIQNANNGETILIEPGTYKVHGINITKNICKQKQHKISHRQCPVQFIKSISSPHKILHFPHHSLPHSTTTFLSRITSKLLLHIVT